MTLLGDARSYYVHVRNTSRNFMELLEHPVHREAERLYRRQRVAQHPELVRVSFFIFVNVCL